MIVKYKNIAISGAIGTGKSTLARNLAQKLGWPLLSSGTFFRKWHEEHGVPLSESEKIPAELDREIDFGYQKKMQNEEHIIFESHLAGWLGKDLPMVFKILCTADDKVRMERAAKRDNLTIKEAIDEAKQRSKAHQEKFKRLYGIDDQFDPEYFDLIVDTTKMTPDQVLQEVLDKISSS